MHDGLRDAVGDANGPGERLKNRSVETGLTLARLRRRVLFERIVTRLDVAEPGRWVVKGGMALEVRLRDEARLTKDIDLGLRDRVLGGAELHERLRDALMADPDGFRLAVDVPIPLGPDGTDHVTWRVGVELDLDDKPFGAIKLDISPRVHDLDVTDRMALPNSLGFAGIPVRVVEVIDIQRHAAEKLHGMLRSFGDRDNTRVRDLIDLVLLIERGLLDPAKVEAATRQVWVERDGVDLPNGPSGSSRFLA